MENRTIRSGTTATKFKEICQDSEFWSCFGYEGLTFVFDLPLEPFQSLLEVQKRALMALLDRLAKSEESPLHVQIRNLDGLDGTTRLTSLVDLSAEFAPRL